jgi:hypothetical protein
MVLRQKVWIDGNVQGVLIGRIVLYWAVGMLYVALGSICSQYYEHPEWGVGRHLSSLFEQFWPWIPSLVLLMPLVIHDIIRMSNLFTGPIYRLRVHLAELLVNPECLPLKFREDDYWHDLVAPMNRIQDDILALRAALAQAASAKESKDADTESVDVEANSSRASIPPFVSLEATPALEVSVQ